jgi:hypothetical protein
VVVALFLFIIVGLSAQILPLYPTIIPSDLVNPIKISCVGCYEPRKSHFLLYILDHLDMSPGPPQLMREWQQ